MAKSVWKFPLGQEDEEISVQMPDGAQVLTLQMQAGIPCLWALVDPTAKTVTRHFFIVGTGHELWKDGQYIGTWQVAGGALVWHLFEELA